MHNTGEMPALIAAASLFADYVLTVAVSVSSGTEALTSAFPFFSSLYGRNRSDGVICVIDDDQSAWCPGVV